ncbi:MAG: MFS transporter [Rubripirellula sp.]|nr:MFS transporter [Rubripirellula sp.]
MIPVFSHSCAKRLPFFYGYVMIPVAMLLQIATSPGQTFAVSAFTPYLRESLELSDSQLSLAYMLGTLLAALPLMLVGPLSDRYGLQGISLIAIGMLAAACYFAAKVTNFYSLLAAFFLLRFLGQGSLSLLSGNTISMWFRNRIGRVSAAISIGTAIAFAWIPEWLHGSILTIGWRETYEWLAIIISASMLPIVFFLFCNRPEDIGQTVDGNAETIPDLSSDGWDASASCLTLRQAIRCRAFSILAASNTIWAMAGTGIVFYLFTLCNDLGFEPTVPANLFKTFGLMMLLTQLLGGVLADFLPLNRLLTTGTIMLSAGLATVSFGQTELALHAFVGLFGAGQGLLLAVGNVIWVRYFGRTHLGAIRGTAWCCMVAGSGCGPLLMGVARDIQGNFDPALYLFLSLMVLLSLFAIFATPPPTADRH